MAFLPAAPGQPHPVKITLADLPQVEPNVFLSETPSFVTPRIQVPPRPSPADMRAKRAQERFEAGQRLLTAGENDGARREFDAALDILLTAPEDMPDRIKVEKKLEQLVAAIHRHDVNGLGAGDDQPGWDKAPLEDILELTFPVDPGLKVKVKEQAIATVSQLPLEVNDAVLSYINYFSSEKGRRTLLAGLKRAGRYRPLIMRILAAEGIPQELIYLAQAESGFLPRAVSHKAATGMWQFVKWRGNEYGLMQTAHADDRLDPEKATRSAARHLRDLYEQFGDWYLAIAGYNCGPGCVERAVERTGYADFWELRARGVLPRETANYVPIILAMTIMAKNARAYGIEDIEIDAPLQYETLVVSAPTHLALVADLAEHSLSDLRELNPALLRNIAPAGYELRVPDGTRTTVISGLEAIPESRRASWRVHRVAEGETLDSIARRYRTSASSILAANGRQPAETGDKLIIPAPPQPVKAIKSSKHGSTKKATAARNTRSSRASTRPVRKGGVGAAALR